MRSWLSGVQACAVIALAGCVATSPTSQSSKGTEPRVHGPAPMATNTEAPDLGVLGPYGIPQGRCGMILYTLAGATPVPIFRSTDDGNALMDIEGAVTQIVLVGRKGETRMAIPSGQYFQGTLTSGGGVQVAAETQWGKEFRGGAYVERGTLTVTASDGWSRVVPVAGIAGCRALSQG
ncbi:MAG: hypothetical protein AAF986_00480 [Pseudomonadota bacterium]